MTIVASSLMFVVASAGIDIQQPDNILWLQFISQIISFLFTAILFAWLFYGRIGDFFKCDFSVRQWGMGGIAMFILLLAIPAVDWLTTWNDAWHLPSSMAAVEELLRAIGEKSEQIVASLLMKKDLPHLILNLIVVALCPAICEEVFFRGALQQALQRWFRNPHWAILVTAVVFSLAHAEIFAFLPRFALGVLLGYLFYLSGSIVVSCCAHFLNNALIVILYYLYANGVIVTDPSAPLQISAVITILCILAASILFYQYFALSRQTKAHSD